MKRLLTGIVALGALLLTGPVSAQNFPERPITLINPYAAGGPADLIARTIGDRMSEIIGQPVVVENRPGGGATIGAAHVARANPDGYTLFIGGSPSHIISPALMGGVAYDGIEGFTPVATVVNVANVIVVNTENPITSIEEMVKAAKGKPGSLTYGTAGVGSLGQFAGELLKQAADIDVTHVPYQGAAPAVADLLANNITMAILNVPPVVPHVQADKFRPLATTTQKRAKQLPDTPTLEELGYAGFDVNTWYGISAPAGTPQEIVQTLYEAIAKTMETPEVTERLAARGVDVFLQNPEEFSAYLRADAERMLKIIKTAGIRRE